MDSQKTTPPPPQDAATVLRDIATRLEAGFNGRGKKTGFMLLTWDCLKQHLPSVPSVNFVANEPNDVMDKVIIQLMAARGYHFFRKATDLKDIPN